MKRLNGRVSLYRTLERGRVSLPGVSGDWRPMQESTLCRVCHTHTQLRKPYCLKHLDRIPYVAELKATLAKSRVPTRLTG